MRNPPLVFVLSEKDCSMLLFPFINKDKNDLVECVLLPEIPIWANKVEEGALLNRHLLVVMVLICGGRGKDDEIDYMQYKYVYPSGGTKKSVIKEKVQTVRENMIDMLQKAEKKRQDAEKKGQEAERKVDKMERQITSLRNQLQSQAKV